MGTRGPSCATSVSCDDYLIYYSDDANFIVTTLADTGGDVIERYVYTPYEVLTIYDASWSNTRGVSSYDVEYTYTGRRLDGETGLYYYGHLLPQPAGQVL